MRNSIQIFFLLVGGFLAFGGVGYIEYQWEFFHNDSWQVWLIGLGEAAFGAVMAWIAVNLRPAPYHPYGNPQSIRR